MAFGLSPAYQVRINVAVETLQSRPYHSKLDRTAPTRTYLNETLNIAQQFIISCNIVLTFRSQHFEHSLPKAQGLIGNVWNLLTLTLTEPSKLHV